MQKNCKNFYLGNLKFIYEFKVANILTLIIKTIIGITIIIIGYKIATSGRNDLTIVKITWKEEEIGICEWLVFRSIRWRRREKHRKEKLCSGFLIRKVLCKVGVFSEYRIRPWIIKRNAYQKVVKFQERPGSLPIENANYCSVISPDKLIEIQPHCHENMEQWVVEDHIERYTGLQHPPMTNAWEGRYIVWLVMQKSTTTSRTFTLKMSMFAAYAASARTMWRRLQRELSEWWPLLRLPLKIQQREWLPLWYVEQQSWIQHNVVFSGVSRFYML